MAAINLLKLSLSSPPSFTHNRYFHRPHSIFLSPPRRRRNFRYVNSVVKSVDFDLATENQIPAETSFLLEVSDMMCGACVSRVKNILTADERVESAVVNMLTETAAIRLKLGGVEGGEAVAEDIAARLTECGYETKRRVAGSGVSERVRKWEEMLVKKKKAVEDSRNRVVIAWCLVAVCCGEHGGHLLHSLGVHVAHGISYYSPFR